MNVSPNVHKDFVFYFQLPEVKVISINVSLNSKVMAKSLSELVFKGCRNNLPYHRSKVIIRAYITYHEKNLNKNKLQNIQIPF